LHYTTVSTLKHQYSHVFNNVCGKDAIRFFSGLTFKNRR